MIKKFGRILLVSTRVGCFTATPVLAAPSVDEIQASKNAAQAEADSLQAQLTDLMDKINQLESDLITKGEEITQATADLEAAQEKEQKQYEDMKLRIKYMYEEGDTSFIESLLECRSITELLNKAQYVQDVHNYDREQLEEYTKTKQQVADLKTQLEEEQANLMNMQADYEAQKSEVDTLLTEKKNEVANLDEQLQAAIQAAAEEQARREREAAAAAAQNNRGNGNTNTSNSSNSSNSNHNSNGSNNSTVNNDDDTSYEQPSAGGTSAANAIVNAAYSQLGVPYVWGGTSPGSGLDCSGLTQYCHRVAGISIPRTSGPQGAGGKAVSNPLPGDIVCYSGHVGIYIGGGQMIHAPQPGDVVRIANVYGSPWYRRYW